MASQKVKKEQEGSAKRMSRGRRSNPSKDDLERMVEEATVDAYDESEQVTGFYTMFENDLELPFNTVEPASVVNRQSDRSTPVRRGIAYDDARIPLRACPARRA